MSDNNIVLKGITWNHSRGYCPLVATTQRFSEVLSNVNIEWSKRSLQKFANQQIEDLAIKYDLLVIDHPWAGFAAASDVIMPLDSILPTSFLKDQAINSVGESFNSYYFNGNHFAIPIDAAAPVAASRPDLLLEKQLSLPTSFADLLDLALTGVVTMPGIAIDTLMNFYMMCCAAGEDPFLSNQVVVSQKIGIRALEMLKELADRLNPQFFDWNPINVYEAMTNTNDLAYCPWAYGYTNYARSGYADNLLNFHNLIYDNENKAMRSTLGGTGIAISTHCKNVDIALKYIQYVTSEKIQRTLFFDNGGQPSHREAWLDNHTNKQSGDFFKSTIKTLESSFVRPRYNGYMHFQDNAGGIIRQFLMQGGKASKVLSLLNELYLESRKETLI